MEPSRPNDEKDLLQSLGCNTVKQEILAKEVGDKIEAKIAEASRPKTQPKAPSCKKKSKQPLREKRIYDIGIDNSTTSESLEYSDASVLTIFSESDEKYHKDNLSPLKDTSSLPSNSSDCTSHSSQLLSSKKSRKKAKYSYSSESYHESCSDSSDEYFSEDVTSEDESSDAKKVLQHPDDSNPAAYQKRLDAWSKIRKSHRKSEIKVSEQKAPHPLYPDKELNGVLVPGEIVKDLMEYQITGVSWFLKLFSWKQGGVLADEMGLGKTIQTIAFLASLYYSGKLKKPSLIICPATLTQQWMQEFHAWWPPLRIINLHSSVSRTHFTKSAKARTYAEQYFDKKGVIFLASYEGVASYGASFTRLHWSCIILDEGHKISNPDTKISRTVKQFITPYRYILSGTPIQNKLKELWSIYDFVRPGLLGSLEEFDKRIARSIELIGSKGSDSCDRQLAAACARNLRSVIKTYILRRLKSDVAQDLPKKNEQVVYCQLQPRQRQEYIDYLNSKQCQMILDNKLNHMVGISTLRKISNHPDLIYYKNKHLKEKYGYYKASGKTRVLDGLLHLWKGQGHRVLIFCQTVQTMEIIQSMSFFEANKLVCMNGNTPVGKRMALVDQFNTDESIFAFLLTTRTGGQGLNLTGANRVVIFDPDWNPTADLQALSRAWRIGQSKEVSIFRLLSAGTIEERVHHLQLYKQLLSDRILKNPQQKLIFRNHTNDLFAPPPEIISQEAPAALNQDGKTSISEAKLALLNSKKLNEQSEQKEDEAVPSDKHCVFDALGFGTESSIKLDQEYEAMTSLSSTAAWDKFAMKRMGLQVVPIEPSTSMPGIPDLPASAFHTKGKKQSINLPPPPAPKVIPSASLPFPSYLGRGLESSKLGPQKRQPTLNVLYAQKLANSNSMSVASTSHPGADRGQDIWAGTQKRQPTLNVLYEQKLPNTLPVASTLSNVSAEQEDPTGTRAQKRQPTLNIMYAQKMAKLSHPNK